MKKFQLAAVLAMFAIVICAAVIGSGSVTGTWPFKGLDSGDIAFASVTLSPPGRTIEVSDTDELAQLLGNAIVYGRDDSCNEYTGQGVTYTITLTDGSVLDVTAYNPFLIIGSAGYRTKYEPCDALSSYANDLLNSGTAIDYMTEPPALAVMSDNTSVGALRGTYSWYYPNADGTYIGIESDSAHPLDCQKWLAPLDTFSSEATLSFMVEPDEIIAARRWSDASWGEYDAESFDVPVNGLTLELEPGGWIYEVEARWDDVGGGGGTAYYSFWIVYTAE